MIIANPIYDVVFKRLMQNSRIARFFIETLTGESLEVIDLDPQELVYTTGQQLFSIFRYDFIATVKTTEGEYKKVLIEIQKAKNAIDLMRFRRYLGEQYKKDEEAQKGQEKSNNPLVIIPIYLLGFDLPGIAAAAVKVERNYIDLLTHKTIAEKSYFIERLSHDCYVVQMSKIHTKLHTDLEELLSIFEQTNFVDENGIIKEYKHEIRNEVVKSMVDMLHYVGTDPAEKKEIEVEQEAWRTINAMIGDTNKELAMQLERTIKALDEERNVREEERKAKEALISELAELKRKFGLE
jgi:hypothetical protein